MDNYKDIQKAAAESRTTPPNSAWKKLDNKLDHKNKLIAKARQKKINYLTSLVAFGIILVGAIFIYNETHRLPDPASGQIAQWEDLELNSDQYYDVDRLHLLHEAYEDSGLYN